MGPSASRMPTPTTTLRAHGDHDHNDDDNWTQNDTTRVFAARCYVALGASTLQHCIDNGNIATVCNEILTKATVA